jgi:acyl-CoA hydrolase
VYVAVDDEDEPTEVPDLTVPSKRGRELQERALEDRADR